MHNNTKEASGSIWCRVDGGGLPPPSAACGPFSVSAAFASFLPLAHSLPLTACSVSPAAPLATSSAERLLLARGSLCAQGRMPGTSGRWLGLGFLEVLLSVGRRLVYLHSVPACGPSSVPTSPAKCPYKWNRKLKVPRRCSLPYCDTDSHLPVK